MNTNAKCPLPVSRPVLALNTPKPIHTLHYGKADIAEIELHILHLMNTTSQTMQKLNLFKEQYGLVIRVLDFMINSGFHPSEVNQISTRTS